ncbi:chemotaxis protein [Microvirga sp. 2TAF3]|uniref:chemotaxis protein n=1 Tax=Microvirga sp. 2TAF3 TaxID=3233014 RepID=UPI003F9B5133
MKVLSRLVLATAALLSAGKALAEPQGSATYVEPVISQPMQMTRTLQLMQDQIAMGSTDAHVGQRGLLTILDDRFMSLDDTIWKDSRNARAAVIFVLSGGSPKFLRKLLSPRLIEMEDLPLVEGALAYVEGREEEARASLMPINAALLPVTLGAQIALVQSALAVRTDPVKAMELLDLVRLQAPGTLLEEAALRRQVFIASQIDDDRKFELLVSDYLRRYRHSVYAGNFRQRLASALTRLDFAKDPDRFSRIVTMLQELETDVQRDLYLLAARTSVEEGRVKSALLTAEMALRLSDRPSVNATRAMLYQAAAMIVSPKSLTIGLDQLRSIDRGHLGEMDQKLLDSAISMGNQIRRLPGDTIEDEKTKALPQKPSIAQAPEQLPTITRAQEALKRVDQLIKY